MGHVRDGCVQTEQPPGGAVLQFNRTPTIQQAAVPQDPGSSWYPKHGVDGEAVC